MASLPMKTALLSTALGLLVSNGSAFTVAPGSFLRQSGARTAGPLFMSDEEEKTITIDTKTQKELSYDSKLGRFFESGDSEECIPDDEYCAVDKETGEMIRLTVVEKERIFLDALQVSTHFPPADLPFMLIPFYSLVASPPQTIWMVNMPISLRAFSQLISLCAPPSFSLTTSVGDSC